MEQVKTDLQTKEQNLNRPSFGDTSKLSSKQKEDICVKEIIKAHKFITRSQKELNGVVFQTGEFVSIITKNKSNSSKYLDKLHENEHGFPSRQTCQRYKKFYEFVKDYITFLECDYTYSKILDNCEDFKKILNTPENQEEKEIVKFFKFYSLKRKEAWETEKEMSKIMEKVKEIPLGDKQESKEEPSTSTPVESNEKNQKSRKAK